MKSVVAVLSFVFPLVAVAQASVEINVEELNQVLSPPRIVGATSCTSEGRLRVSLTGGNEGNNYEVFEFDPAQPLVPIKTLGVFPVTIDATGITFAEIALNGPAPLIGAVQIDPQGNSSALSAQFQVEDPATRTKGGELPFPVWACGRATYSVGHQPGDMLLLYGTEPNTGDYLRFKLPSALGTNDYLAIGSPMFRHTEKLSLVTVVCDVGSFRYDTTTWHFLSGQQLPKPRFDTGLVLPGAPTFNVGNVPTGALLRVGLTRLGSRTDWTEACADSPCTAFVPAPLGGLLPGDQIEVTQELCDGTTSAPASVDVADCSNMPTPGVVTLPRFGDTSTQVTVSPPGVTNVVLVGDGFGPRDNLRIVGAAINTSFVGFMRPLAAPDAWMVVAQPTDACPSPLGADFSIVP